MYTAASAWAASEQARRVASTEYPYGTLEKQKPFFKERGLNLDPFFEGTLNISIAPYHFVWVKPQYTFHGVAWTDLHPPEDFSFQPCRVRFAGRTYEGYIYYPHPETKIRHFEEDTIVEVITTWIPELHYGNAMEIDIDEDAMKVTNSEQKGQTKHSLECFKVK